MTKSAIIKELLSIESEAGVYAKGMDELRERSYLLRKKLEGGSSPSAFKKQPNALDVVQAQTEVRFAKKYANKRNK